MALVTSADIVVVGSGLGGMMAALRAHDLRLKAVIIEKCPYYGGTSAFSGGGIWIPNHRWLKDVDSPEQALAYLHRITRGKGDDRKFRAFLDNAPVMAEYAMSLGARLFMLESVPDYFSEVEGAMSGRQLSPRDYVAKPLGDEFHRMRASYPGFFVAGRYQLGLNALGPLMNRGKGWLKESFKLVAGYWADIGWRLKTSRDSRLSMGSAFVGYLRQAMMERDIPLLLNTGLIGLEKSGDRVTGVRVVHNGNERVIAASAVILAAGGFDQNQAMRDSYHPVHTDAANSLTPPGGNEGDAIRAGQAIGAAIENMENSWWAPSFRIPTRNNMREPSGQLIFERARPGSVCVNRLGKRFVNEAVSYDRFGHAMIADHQKTGANLPCWMIFDARYRRNYNVSNLLPGWLCPDSRLPPEYLDSILYRAATIEDLAGKIDVDPETLMKTVAAMNDYARTGKDLEFQHGDFVYDRAFGEAGNLPNPNLGLIAKAPFYAIKVELGDLGTKGGLRVDECARVLDVAGDPIKGLYATGNTTGSLFVDTYPGPGSTLGAAMTFAFVGANHAAADLAGPA
jgi:3-oxosteroid 1-dehydrogenase